jgi:3-hydroxyisobutyrate dehydrogenase
MANESTGFIGLGDMGEPMAACILAAGYPVVGCANRSRQAIEGLKAKGLLETANPAEVGARVDILITCVLDEAQTDAVLRGPNGALATLKPGAVVIVTSTLSPAYCQALAIEAARGGIDVLDCPVSGARPRAEQGTLALICGGEPGVIERCRAVMEAMGDIHHCGPVGMGQVAKLVNQGMLYSILKLIQEGRAMARAYGMEADTLMGVLGQSMGNTTAGENWDMFAANWSHIKKLGQKDIDLCITAARANQAAIPLIEARRDMSWEMPGET